MWQKRRGFVVIATLAAAGRQNSTRRIKREDRIDPRVPTHPAVFRKSADLVGCKGALKHSFLKEGKERAKGAPLSGSTDSMANRGLNI
jgi:hypothetical protein